MSCSSPVVPLLPSSIAVGLADDLVQYLVELKFLLLFFDKPLCLMANSGFQFLSEEAVHDFKRGKKPQTTIFKDDLGSHLKNTAAIQTDEWDEVFSQCRFVPLDVQLDATYDDLDRQPADKVFDRSGLTYQEFAESSREHLADPNLPEDVGDRLLGHYLLRMNMRMMFDVLEMCCNERIPMIWGNVGDVGIAREYTKYLLGQLATDPLDAELPAVLRTLHGDDLLRSIFELNIVNVATVPVDKLLEFRSKHEDLLKKFLTSYRGYLTELESEPANYRKITLARTQKIAEELDIINSELLALRRSEKYKWLERVSTAIFDGAKSGALIATWNLLATPVMLATQFGKACLSAAGLMASDIRERGQLEQALLFRSSSGYLWKAAQLLK